MRAKLGAAAAALIAIGALVGPANSKTAEARSNVAPVVGVVQPRPAAVASLVVGEAAPERPASRTVAPKAAPTVAATVAAAIETITPPPADLRLENRKLRRMQKHEVTPAMLQLAANTVRKHYAKPVGTLVESEVEGKRVIARIERHFHPEGGSVKPWGFHPGVSLFVAR